jgi:PadR family transcriptional regulator, regulatory protein AphA
MAVAAKAPTEMEVALLGFLLREPMHAYEIHLQLRHAESLGLVWRLKQGHLYALLARLEEAGYVIGSVQQQAMRPPRKVLALTAAGGDAFAAWLTEPVAHGRDFRLTFLAKLYFAVREGGSRVAQLVARQRAECERWLADFESRASALAEDQRYDRLVLAFRASQIEAILRWLDACDASLGAADAGNRSRRLT